MKIRAEALSDRGLKRKRNEDSVVIDNARGLYVVADGAGGHSHGDLASHIAVDIIKKFYDPGRPAASLRTGIRAAHRALRGINMESEAEEGQYPELYTTITALAIVDDTGYIANIGDSKCKIFRDGQLTQLTRDHSQLGLIMEEKGLTYEEAVKDYPDAAKQLTQALGPDWIEEPEIYTEEVQLRPDDYILLHTDGLDPVGNKAIMEVTKSLEGGGQDLDKACQQLISLANQAGGEDNTSVILIGCGTEEPLPLQKIGMDVEQQMVEETLAEVYGKPSIRSLFDGIKKRAKAVGAVIGACLAIAGSVWLYDWLAKTEKPVLQPPAIHTPISEPTKSELVPRPKTKAIGPTRAVLSEIRNVSFDNDLVSFHIKTKGRIDSLYAWFENNPEPGKVYMAKREESGWRFTIKMPQNGGKLNVVADYGGRWVASWKYSLGTGSSEMPGDKPYYGEQQDGLNLDMHQPRHGQLSFGKSEIGISNRPYSRFDRNRLTKDDISYITAEYAINSDSLGSISRRLTDKYGMRISENMIRKIARECLGDDRLKRRDRSAGAQFFAKYGERLFFLY